MQKHNWKKHNKYTNKINKLIMMEEISKLNLETHGTCTVVDVNTLAPRVLAVNVTTVEVDVWSLV